MDLQFRVHIGQFFTMWTSMTGPIIVPPGIAARTLDRGFTWKVYILYIMEWSAENRRPRQVWFCCSNQLKPGARTMRLRKPLWIELFSDSDSKSWFPANCFHELVLEKIPKVLHLAISHWLTVTGFSKRFFLCLFFLCQTEFFTPVRNCSVNTELIYRMNDSEQELCVWSIRIEVYGVPVIFLFQDSTTRRPVSLKLWSPIFLQVCKEEFHTISFRHQDRGTSSVPARISSQSPRLFLNSKYKFHRFLFLSNRCCYTLTWRWSVLWIFRFNVSFSHVMRDFLKNLQWRKFWWMFQVQCSVLANHPGSSEESAMT